MQHSLLEEWTRWRGMNIQPFSLSMSFNRVVPTGQHFLIFQNDVLHVAKGTRNVTRGATIGGIPLLKTQVMFVPSPFSTDTEASNIFDASVKVSGLRTPRMRYEFVEFRKGGKRINRQGMTDLLGAITLPCVLLKNEVLPSGRFRYCVQVQSEDEFAIRQKVEFNVPLPIGVFLSTLSHEETQICMLADHHWNHDWDCSAPVFQK